MSGNYLETDAIERSEFLKILGQHIKKVRLEKGLSAAEFARRAFMERSHVARLEAGNTNPTATTLRIVCLTLEIEFEELFKGFLMKN